MRRGGAGSPKESVDPWRRWSLKVDVLMEDLCKLGSGLASVRLRSATGVIERPIEGELG